MRNQSLLVVLLVMIVAVVCHSLPSDNDDKIDEKENEIVRDKNFKLDPKLPKALDARFNKMLPTQKFTDEQLETSTKAEKVQKTQKSSTTEKAVKDETSTIGKS